MSDSSARLVRETRTVAADRQALFDIVADPALHPVIDGSGSVLAVRAGAPARLSRGARFSMHMRIGARYRVTNRVLEFDEPSVIAWRHFNGHVWRYRFEQVPGGTLVTEEWDARPTWNGPLLVLIGFGRRNRRGMRATLERLASLAETGSLDRADTARAAGQ